ncbi:MAG: patatin-like phospholipase family protein [Oscillospiraceae bacterium]|nr:patatin-like phospholipase family protein [Oscillospiraceae bacterium]
MTMKKELGLVLAGGGGKGAYQIGVWKAARELGIDKMVTAVSGASVGALNAALFANGSYEEAEKIWLELTPEKILTPRETVFEAFGDAVHTAVKGIENPDTLVSAVIRKAAEGIWSRHGLEDIIDKYVDLEKISASDIQTFASCTSLSSVETKYFRLNGLPPDEIKKILIASSAIPIVFPNQKIEEDVYIDGGVLGREGNVPVQPLYDAGYRNIIIIYLSERDRIDKSLFYGADITEIVPRTGLGSFVDGTLDFSPRGAKARLFQGYQESLAAFEKMAGKTTQSL